MSDIRRENGVLVLQVDAELLTPDALSAWESALEEVERDETVTAFASTGTGKYYSNGLALEAMMADPDTAPAYLDRVLELLARVLVLPVATVAAVNGHAFGAGAMLALGHDASVMREDRGYWCLPEVDLGLPFAPLMSNLVRGKLTPGTAHDAMTTGRRYPAAEALPLGIVSVTAAEGDVVPTALEWAKERAGKSRHALGAIKSDIYAAVLAERPGAGA